MINCTGLYAIFVALDGSDDKDLVCFKDNSDGLRLLQSKRQETSIVTDPVPSTSSTNSVSAEQGLLDMSVEESE